MRTRVFDDKTVSHSYLNTYTKAGVVTDQFTNVYTGMRLFSRMDDIVTPHFAELSAQGKIFNNPKKKEKVKYTCFASEYAADCTIDGQYTTYVAGEERRVGLTTPPILITDDTAWNAAFEAFNQETDIAITKAHANVDVSEMMLLASVGELPETVAWLTSCIKRLVAATKAFTRRKEVANVLRTLTYNLQEASFTKGASFSKRRLELYKQLLEKRKLRKIPDDRLSDVATAWLEYRYAIRPLLADIKAAIAAIEKVLDRSKRYTARGKSRNVQSDVITNRDLNVLGPDRLLAEDLRIERKNGIIARAGILYAIEHNLDFLSTLLGLDQPIVSAYNLIPYSFVIDWVVGIGDWLQSLTKSSGLSALSSWVTLSYLEEVKITPFNPRCRTDIINRHNWQLTDWKPGSFEAKVERYWRVPEPPIPLLPSFNLKLNLSKILDLGFILRQTLSGHSTSVAKRS